MVRLSIVLVILVGVSLIGMTFYPLEKLSYIAYNAFEPLGINVSFTPLTVDMSMMTSSRGENQFSKNFDLVVSNQGLEETIAPSHLNLYSAKIPLILFMEQAMEGGDLAEARFALCFVFSGISKKSVDYFYLKRTDSLLVDGIFNKKFYCEFT